LIFGQFKFFWEFEKRFESAIAKGEKLMAEAEAN